MSSILQIKKKRGSIEVKTNAMRGVSSLGQSWEKIQAQQQQYALVNMREYQISTFNQEQVVQMEESPAKSKLQDLKKKKLRFRDDKFPPDLNSLTGQWKQVPQWRDIEWNKLSSVLPKAKIFQSCPKANHIKQGQLGDCYFLAGLAAICERPDRIYNLFMTQEQNQQKCYTVKMLYRGKWMVIDLDQYIPVSPTQKKLSNSIYPFTSTTQNSSSAPVFSKAIDNSLWVILLQKAWAKLYTSYKRIESGFPQQTLHDLTGAPCETLNLSDYKKRQNNWSELMTATKRHYAMVCSSRPGSDTDQTQTGVVEGHAYTLLSAFLLIFKGRQHRLIKLRNPWGQVEYNGPWSDYDPNWQFVDNSQKSRLGFNNDKQDGVFFIGYEKFCQEFKSVTIGEINDDASYLYKSAKDSKLEGCYFKIQIKQQGEYALQVDKTPQRSFQEKRQTQYDYPQTTINLVSLEKGKLIKKGYRRDTSRTTWMKRLNLSPGFYIAKVLIEFNPKFQTQFDVNLAIYAQYPCVIQLASNSQAAMMEGKPVSWKGEEPKGPSIWNRQSAWEQPKKEQKLSFSLDFNGNWMNN